MTKLRRLKQSIIVGLLVISLAITATLLIGKGAVPTTQPVAGANPTAPALPTTVDYEYKITGAGGALMVDRVGDAGAAITVETQAAVAAALDAQNEGKTTKITFGGTNALDIGTTGFVFGKGTYIFQGKLTGSTSGTAGTAQAAMITIAAGNANAYFNGVFKSTSTSNTSMAILSLSYGQINIIDSQTTMVRLAPVVTAVDGQSFAGGTLNITGSSTVITAQTGGSQTIAPLVVATAGNTVNMWGGKIVADSSISGAIGSAAYISGGTTYFANTFNLYGGAIEGNQVTTAMTSAATNGYALYTANQLNFNMYGGRIESKASTALYIAVAVEVNIKGGEIIAGTHLNSAITYDASIVGQSGMAYTATSPKAIYTSGGTVNISEGTFKSSGYCKGTPAVVQIANGNLNITGGTFTYTETVGGTLPTQSDYTPYGIYNSGTGTVSISDAEINFEGNATIVGAAIGNNTTGTVVVESDVEINADSGLAIRNTAGGTVKVAATINATEKRLYPVYNHAGGTIKVEDGFNIKTSATESITTGTAIHNQAAGTIEVNGGTVEATTGTAIHNQAAGTIRVNGGTVKATTGNAIYNFANSGKIEINEVDSTVPTLVTSDSAVGTIVLNVATASGYVKISGGSIVNTTSALKQIGSNASLADEQPIRLVLNWNAQNLQNFEPTDTVDVKFTNRFDILGISIALSGGTDSSIGSHTAVATLSDANSGHPQRMYKYVIENPELNYSIATVLRNVWEPMFDVNYTEIDGYLYNGADQEFESVVDLPAGITIEYTYKKSNVVVTETKNVGTYVISTEILGTEAYKYILDIPTFEFKILPAPILAVWSDPVENDGTPFVYDGTEKKIEFIGATAYTNRVNKVLTAGVLTSWDEETIGGLQGSDTLADLEFTYGTGGGANYRTYGGTQQAKVILGNANYTFGSTSTWTYSTTREANNTKQFSIAKKLIGMTWADDVPFNADGIIEYEYSGVNQRPNAYIDQSGVFEVDKTNAKSIATKYGLTTIDSIFAVSTYSASTVIWGKANPEDEFDSVVPSTVRNASISFPIANDSSIDWINITNIVNSYQIDPAVSAFQVLVVPKVIDIDWAGLEHTYDGAEHTATATVKTGHLFASHSVNVVVELVGLENGAIKAGTYALTAKLSPIADNSTQKGIAGSYIIKAASATNELVIKQKELTVSWSNQSLVYNASNQMPTAVLNGVVGQDLVNVSVSGAVKNVGNNYTATATLAGTDNANYVIKTSDKTANFEITPATVAINWGSMTMQYSGQKQTPTAEITGIKGSDVINLVFTFTTLDGIRAGITGATVTLDNENYTLAAVETISYEITKKMLTIGWDSLELEYTGEEVKPIGTLIGVVTGEIATLVITAHNSIAMGNYVATLNLTGTHANNYSLPNYTVSYSIGQKIITLAWATESFTYNGLVQKPAKPTISGTLGTDTVDVTIALETGSNGIDAGEHVVTITLVGDLTKYKLAATTYTYTIAAKTITLTWAGNSSLVYTGTAKNVTASIPSGVIITGETVTVSVAGGTAINAGAHEATATLGGADAANYVLANATQSYTIAKAVVTLTWENATGLVYNGEAKNVTATIASGVVTGETVTVSVAGGKGTNAASYTATATLTGEDAANYTITEATKSYTIVAKEVTLTWSGDTNLVYNSKEQKPTATVGGLVGNDRASVTLTYATGSNGRSAGTQVVNVALTNSNYKLAQADETKSYTIAVKGITITWTGYSNLVYDGNAKNVRATLSGVPSSDAVTATVEGGNAVSAGTHEAEVTLSGADAANYTITAGAKREYTIAKSTPNAPTASVESSTTNSITVKSIAGAEYRIGDGDWKDSNTFTGLDADTDYTIYVRIKATVNSNASEESSVYAYTESESKSCGTFAFSGGNWLPTLMVLMVLSALVFVFLRKKETAKA